jgi:uncharacterized membrane protein
LKHTTLLLALAALAATSCSLQIDSQYGLRWDRRVTVPQRSESEVTEAQPPAETEVVPEVHAVESKPQIETVRPYAAPHAEEADLALPLFGISIDDLPETVALEVEKHLINLKTDRITVNQNNKSVKDEVVSIAFKIASIIVGIVLILLGILLLVLAYLASVVYLDDEAEILTTRGLILLTVGLLFLFLPIIYTVIKSLIADKSPR